MLLAETDLSVTEIGARVGYLSGSHFTKAFRIATGATPREFRKGLISATTRTAQCVANNAQDLSVRRVSLLCVLVSSSLQELTRGEYAECQLQKQAKISPAEGKLGVLLVGLGAVSTTFIAGVEAIKKGFAQPIGSLTQMGTIRLGKRTDNRVPLIKDFVPLAQLKDLVFGAWDIFPDSAYDAALNAGVLEKELLANSKSRCGRSSR